MNRTHVEPLPPDSTSLPEALPGKLGIKIHSHSILYLSVTSHITCIGTR